MKSLKKILSSLFMPVVYANMAGLAAGAVWLAALSQWQFVGLAIALVFFSPHVIPLLLMPAGIFSRFMTLYQNAGRRKKAQAMYILAAAWVLLFAAFWCAGIFEYALAKVGPEELAAGLLWGSTASLLPLLLWSSRDRSNAFVMTVVGTAQAAVLALAALRLSGIALPFWASFATFGGLLALAVTVRTVYEEKSRGKPSVGAS